MIVPLYAMRCDHCAAMTAAYYSRGEVRAVIEEQGWAYSAFSGHACPDCRGPVDAAREDEDQLVHDIVTGLSA